MHLTGSTRFENGIRRIREKAFFYCRGLQKIAFPASLEVIELGAFALCESLREITFLQPSRLCSIRRAAFLRAPLEIAKIRAGVREIDACAFDPRVWQNMRFCSVRLTVKRSSALLAKVRTLQLQGMSK
jgi:hypothetical protein